MIPLPALLAEIRAAGPCPHLEVERITQAQFHELDDCAIASRSAVSCAYRQLRADLARLAAEVERLQAIARCYQLAALEGDSEVGAGLVARDPSFDEEPPDAR